MKWNYVDKTSISFCFTILCVVLYLAPPSSAACYAEEGSQYNITCSTTASTAQNGLHWSFNTTRIAACLDSLFCINTEPDHFIASMDSTKSTLTIMNVSRTVPFNVEHTVWTCEWRYSNYNQTACNNLLVYTVPEKPICERPVMNASNFQIEVVCKSLRVYPQATCYLDLSKDNGTFTTISTATISYIHTPMRGDVLYYTSECTVSLQLSELESHGNLFRVRMRSIYGPYVYGDMSRIELAIVNEDDITTPKDPVTTLEKTDDDSDHSMLIIISLGVLLGVTSFALVVMAVVICKLRRKEPETQASPELPQPEPDPVTRSYDRLKQKDQKETDDDDYYQDVNGSEVTPPSAPSRDSRYLNVPEPADNYEMPEEIYEN